MLFVFGDLFVCLFDIFIIISTNMYMFTMTNTVKIERKKPNDKLKINNLT